MFVLNPSGGDAEETGYCVWRDCHELCSIGIGVAEGLDDGGQEEREGVERSEDAGRHDAEHPDLPVLECIKDKFPRELVGERAAIGFETANHLLLLVLGKKLRSLGVIVHEEVGNASYGTRIGKSAGRCMNTCGGDGM